MGGCANSKDAPAVQTDITQPRGLGTPRTLQLAFAEQNPELRRA
jgi:hypothetical protein